MTHDEAFLQSIIETPDDDAPRLIYADWLEDHGRSERAEFIRVQCEIPKLAEGSLRLAELRARERHLLEAHEKEWACEFKASDDKSFGWVSRLRHGSFVRGFVEELTIGIDDLLTNASRLFARAPIRHLRIEESGDWPSIPRLEACPYLGRIASLGLGYGVSQLGDDELHELSASPRILRRMIRLSASESYRLTATGLKALFSSPNLIGLRSLSLTRCSLVGVEHVKPLVESSRLATLTELALDDNHLRDEGVQSLACSSICSRLTYLSLKDCAFGNAGGVAVGRSPHLSSLRELNLSYNGIGNVGAAALASSPHLAGLEFLNLSYNRIRDGGAQALATSVHLGGLRSLIIWNNELGSAGANVLVARFGNRVSFRG